MKTICKFCLLIIVFTISVHSQEPTFAGLPDSSHVLVVYNSLSQVSVDVKDYYQNARGIPNSNIVPLDSLVDDWITDPNTGIQHHIKLDQGVEGEKELIIDEQGSLFPIYRHSWIYFIERIAEPIAIHLRTTIVNGDPLSETIRFIVLCKGVPFRIQAMGDDYASSCNQNVPVDALLCFLGENVFDPYSLLDFLNLESPDPQGNCQGTYAIANPYYNVDPTFSMDYQFLPNYFSQYNYHFERDITLSYLITHLDAMNLNVIQNMIDSSIAAINSSNYDWFIDADPTPCAGGGLILHQTNTENIFDALGITNYFIDGTETVYTSHLNNTPVMSYISNGTHTSLGSPCIHYFQPDFIQSQLEFSYVAGSVFNTAESFNVNTLGTDPPVRRDGAEMGQIPEFFLTGGTVGVGQVNHGTAGGIVISNDIMLPSYAMGYSFIEAAYLGMKYLTDNRVVVGDPLTRLKIPCEPIVLASNTTLYSGDYECDIIVPEGISLTVESSATINFVRNAAITVYGELNVENNSEINFYGYSNLTIESGGDIYSGEEIRLEFNDKTIFKSNSNLQLQDNSSYVFNDESEFQANGTLEIEQGAEIILSDKAQLRTFNTFQIDPGAEITCQYQSRIWVYDYFYCIGSPTNKITFNFSNTTFKQFFIIDSRQTEINNTIMNNGGLQISLNSHQATIEYIRINNTTFNNSKTPALTLHLGGIEVDEIPTVTNCDFNNCENVAIDLRQINNITLEDNTIELITPNKCISLENNGITTITNCTLTGGIEGIGTFISHPGEIELIEDLETALDIYQCTFNSIATAITIDTDNPFTSVNITNNQFENCNSSIFINNFVDFSPVLTFNTLNCSSYSTGISLSNGNEILVQNNNISNSDLGVSLTNVTGANIWYNSIFSNQYESPGIFLESTDGVVRNNTISGHTNGIQLGNSSPDIGGNTVSDNLNHGIYIGSGSLPNMEGVLVGNPPLTYPISGYNDIYENGGWAGTLDNDGSEIYIANANVILRSGCNSIVDNRIPNGNLINTQALMNSYGDGLPIQVHAENNYWGEHDEYELSERFGSLIVYYEPYLGSPCSIPTGGSGGRALLISSSSGNVIDTLYALPIEVGELTETESLYASAEEKYLTGDYNSAKIIYDQIVNSNELLGTKLKAYQMLYNIGNLTHKTPEFFAGLYSTYSTISESTEDSLLQKVFKQLARLSLVSQKEYISAINEFDAVIQQNPESEEAVYAEIDAITTALMLPQDSSLNKGTLGKYSVSDYSDYTTRISNLLKNGRGKNNESSGTIPTEYYLEQNYPNPFNPVTKIKFSIPKSGNVKLIVYDILGRAVKILTDEVKEPGFYEIEFNASSLASGVYIYRLSTTGGVGNYINTKKMLLLK